MYFLAFERPLAYSHSIEIIQSIPDPSCKYKSFELTGVWSWEGEGGASVEAARGGGEKKNSNNNNVNDVFCPEGERSTPGLWSGCCQNIKCDTNNSVMTCLLNR